MKTKYDTTMERIENLANGNDLMTTELITANMLVNIAESLAIIADGIQALVNEKVRNHDQN